MRELRSDEIRIWAHGASQVFRTYRTAVAYIQQAQRWASDVHAVNSDGDAVDAAEFFGVER